ncbi:MAG: hypothetical protein COB38_07075 [Gammaproteobacteria bacterium]|nr:MAG: hypothetical protein COB38_07075 [Gammaproteobacteria bacterium]
MKFLTIILCSIFLVSCEQEVTVKSNVSFPILASCVEDINNYFDDAQIKAIGIWLDTFDINRRIRGLEHVVGFAEVKSDSLKRADLMSFVNASLKDCTPNSMVLIEKTDPILRRIDEIKNYRATEYKEGTMLLNVSNQGLEVWGNFDVKLPNQEMKTEAAN